VTSVFLSLEYNDKAGVYGVLGTGPAAGSSVARQLLDFALIGLYA
jgi:hypothetical protein